MNLIMAMTQLDVEFITQELFKTKVPKDKWGHIFGSFPKRSSAIIVAAYTKASIWGGSPILLMSEYVSRRSELILNLLARHGKVVFQLSGGVCPFSQNTKIVEELDTITHAAQDLPSLINTKGAKVLILENDPELEPPAILQLIKGWSGKYAALVNMRANNDRLSHHFKRFIGVRDPSELYFYVWTTGIDLEQVESYCRKADILEIKKVVIELKSPDPEIEKEINLIFKRIKRWSNSKTTFFVGSKLNITDHV